MVKFPADAFMMRRALKLVNFYEKKMKRVEKEHLQGRRKMKIKNTEIEIIQGNIVEQAVDAIVIPANNQLFLNKEKAYFIKKAKNSVSGMLNIRKSVHPGEDVILPLEKSKTKYVIFAITMGKDFRDEKKLRKLISNCFKKAEENKINSIAFPALGCEKGNLPLNQSAKIMIEETLNHLDKTCFLKKIIFVLFDKKSYFTFKKVIPDYIGYLERKRGKYPIPTVDIIIELKGGIVLIQRKNPPYGWAIPGGFVEQGESLEEAAIREAKEETNLSLKNLIQFHTYSAPGRDPRFHTISTVFIAQGRGIIKARSDAQSLKIFTRQNLPKKIAFDHRKIIKDYFKNKIFRDNK